jgi:FAD/FMN-containing dehydrogenase
MSLAGFQRVLGAEHVRTIEGERLDDVPIIGEVRPGTSEEVAACLRLATEERQALLACGGGTKLAWGNTPDAPTLVRLSLARLDHPFELDAPEGIATVGGGVPLARLSERATAEGKRTLLASPHDLATVGGGVATDG